MLNKALKIGGAAVALLIGGVATAAALYEPAARAPLEVRVPTDESAVARGRYLANHVLGCVECHSKRDFSRYGAPVVGPIAGGSDCLGEADGMPGRVCAPNLTSHGTGLGDWTDGEILRAIREGVSRDGRALFPMMPYESYRALSDEDAFAVVAYLRTLEPVDHRTPATEVAFPLSVLIKTVPEPLSGPVTGPGNDEKKRGAYLANVAGCITCHSPVDDRHRPIEGKLLAGGQRMTSSKFDVVSPNLTPHETGLTMSKEVFVARLTAMKPEHARPVSVEEQTIMPWLALSGMTPEDAGAIHTFLRSVPPVPSQGEGR